MKSAIETGHSKNLANYEDLIIRASGLGAFYNPTQECITIPAMQATSANARNAIDQVKAAFPVWSNAVAAREKAFALLSSMTTRIINALLASGADEKIVSNARSIARKIQGTRASRKLSPEEKQTMKDQGLPVNQISASQMSFDSRIDNLIGLLHLLETISIYNPNEPDLKTSFLKSYADELKAKNNAVIVAADPLKKARILRNQVLYAEKTGLVATALLSKAYIKSVFGATNPAYKEISKLSFRTIVLS